jgi:hypothetical protein
MMDYPDYSNFPSDYKSPFEPGTAPIGSDYDWGSFSKGIDWNQTPSVSSGNRWGEAFKKATDYLNQSNRNSYLTEERKRQRQAQGTTGVQNLGEGIFIAYPQVIQSAPQQSGFSKALGAASGVLGAVAPFTGPAAPFLGAAAGLAGAGSRIA